MVVTQLTTSCAVEVLRLVTSDHIMTSLLKKVINIDQNSRSKTAMASMASVWSVSKLSTEFVGSRRELVANCVRTADTMQLDSLLANLFRLVETVAKLVANSEYPPPTRLNSTVASRRAVGGVYWS